MRKPTQRAHVRPSPIQIAMRTGLSYRRRMTRNSVGPLVREWRHQRSRSQLDLAYEVGVSPKHLSFVETGRSRPSPELIEALGIHLDIPLRERNAVLVAAGFAPRYRHTPLDDPQLATVVDSLKRLLDAHNPYPGFVLNRHWDVVLANPAANAIVGLLPTHLTTPATNVFRVSLHPDGLASHTRNFDEWATYLLSQLNRLVTMTADHELDALAHEVHAYPNVVDLRARTNWNTPRDPPDLLVPCQLELDGTELSMFTTLTTFGTPRDITLDELAIELFFPNDEVTRNHFHRAQ